MVQRTSNDLLSFQLNSTNVQYRFISESWQQQRAEVADLHGRLEAQGIILSEQSQRLVNNDLLVKEFFVENAQLSERLEHQRSRNSMLMHGHQQNL